MTDLLLERELPNAVEAERAVLGAVLLNSDLLVDAERGLSAHDFYSPPHSAIFAAMAGLYGREGRFDLITLSEELRRRRQLEEVGGGSYLASLIDTIPRLENIEQYVGLVVEAAEKRRLIAAAHGIIAACFEGELTAAQVFQRVEKIRESSPRSAPPRKLLSAAELLDRNFERIRFAVPGILPEGVGLLCGRPKKGKSWWALNVAVAVAAGGVALGRVPVDQGDVLYLALEDGDRRLQGRLLTTLAGSPPPAGLDFATEWPRVDEGGVEMLEAWLEHHPNARLVVVDTLQRIRPKERANVGMYGQDYEAVKPLADLAKRYGVTVLVVHHTRKAGAEDVFDEVSGSTGLTGAADAMLVLRSARGQADAELHLTGRDMEQRELALRFAPADGAWTILGDADEFRHTGERQAILDVLADAPGPMTPKEIAEVLGKPAGPVRFLVHKLAKDGLIRQPGYGRYSLANTSNPSLSANAANTANTPEGGSVSAPLGAANTSLTLKLFEDKELNPTVSGVSTVRGANGGIV